MKTTTDKNPKETKEQKPPHSFKKKDKTSDEDNTGKYWGVTILVLSILLGILIKLFQL